jgi:transcription elongation factor GreA
MISQNLPRYEFSKAGFDEVLKEQKELENQRVDAVENLAKARAMGDLSENGYYKSSRAKLSSIDSRLRRLRLMIKYTVVLKPRKTSKISFGSCVTVKIKGKQKQFEIVGKEESNPMQSKISKNSPIGKALMGKKVGDKVEVFVPAGKVEYEVVKVN